MDSSRTEFQCRRYSSAPITIVIVLLSVAFIYWARPVLVPLALSVFFAFLLNPIVTYLQRRRIPRTASAFLVTIAAGVILVALGWLVSTQLMQLAERLPQYERRLTARIDELRENGRGSLLSKVQTFADRISKAVTGRTTAPDGSTPQPVVLVGEGSRSLTPIFSSLGPAMEPLAAFGLIIVQLIYLLVDSENLRDRFLTLAGQGNMTLSTKAMDEAGSRISNYLLAQFGLNVAYGVGVAIGLFMLGVPHALLWGFLAGLLRYIPYLGPIAAVCLPLLMSLMTTEGWTQPICVAILFLTLEIVSNAIVEPLVYGKSIGVSQSALIVAIAFWAWLWGPVGLVLAAPLTVCLAIIGKYVPTLKFFEVLLGDAPTLTADVRFYQRLLAHDQDGAFQVIALERDKKSLISIFDQILIPALCHARRDCAANQLDEEDVVLISTIAGEIGEELAITQPEKEIAEEEPAAKQSVRVKILACAAEKEADEAALKFLRFSLDLRQVVLETATTNRLASEVAALAEDSGAAIVCIITLPPGGIARTRLLCKKLRQKLPEVKIVVGRWGHDSPQDENQKQFIDAGADYLCSSVEETSQQLQKLAQLVRPASAATVTPPHFDVAGILLPTQIT